MKLIATLLFVILSFGAHATHLIGGNMGYEFIGPDPLNPGFTRYRITLDAYMDCNSVNWVQPGGGGGSFPEPSINVGIYEGVLNPTTSLPYTDDVNLQLVDSNAVDPNLPAICDPFNLLSNVCVYLVRYEAIVSLPASNTGYWVLYDRCCRPGGILNLNNSGAQSFAYTTWIPAQNGSLITNSSAQFTDTLLSYICRTDTAYISNSAIDPDGDSIAYTLVTPFRGLTGAGGAAPPPSVPYNDPLLNPYNFPPPFVNYATGYNLPNLLGTGSFSAIDPATGLTRFITNFTGIFVASVEITEYRNGQIVGVTRRNMQLISDDCPNNNMPNQNTSNLDPDAITPLDYEVNAGDTICFNLDYDDLDNDPLEFVATSDIFNSAITNPPATVTSPVTGIGSVTGTICWNTSCAQGRAAPYVVDVVVTDSNCPPLPLPQLVHIYVRPFEGPQEIYGDSVVCIDNNTSLFTTDTLNGVSYSWSVTGGSISSGNGSPTVNVQWNPGMTTGSISVTATNQNGCVVGPLTKNVVLSNVIGDAGLDQTTCNGIAVTIGGSPTSQDPNNSIIWSPATGLSNPNDPNPMATPTSTTTYVVSLTNALGCVGTDTVVVSVNNLIPSGILSDYFVCPGDTLQMNATGATFTWGPNQFISATNIGNPQVYPPSNITYTLNYFDVNGCEGNDTTDITVNATVPTDAGPDAQVCLGDSFTLGGNPTGPFGTTYLWSPSTNMNNNTLSNPSVLPTSTTTYIVQTSNDTCTGVDTVVVSILPAPSLSVTPDTYVCEGDSVQINATGTGTFLWNNGITLSDSTIADPLAFPSVPTYYTVTLTDGNNCEAIDSVFVDIQSLPVASAGGVVDACKFLPTPIGGSPTGPPNSTYLWTPSTGLNFNGLANPLVTSDVDRTYIVQVTDSLGCVAYDTVEVQVFRLAGGMDTTVCNNITLTLNTNTVNGTAPYTYQWTNGSALSDSTSGSPTITTGNQNNFTVTVTDATGCRDTVDFIINLLGLTNSNFAYDIIPTCTGVGVKLTNTSSGASSYEWYIDNQLSSTDENPTLVFDYNKSATVTLITTSSDGCVDTSEVNITGPKFTELVDITVPNVFTPNEDGENDYFEINYNGDLSSCIEMTIFNRDGQIVYQSSGGIHTWDGRSSTGQQFPDGVYFYIYTINGEEYKGSLTLMR